MNTAKKPPVNSSPEIVAISFVNRLITAQVKSTSAITATPIGSSRPPTRTLNGTRPPAPPPPAPPPRAPPPPPPRRRRRGPRAPPPGGGGAPPPPPPPAEREK